MEEHTEKEVAQEVAQDVGHNVPEEENDDTRRKRSRSRDDVHRVPQEVEEKPNNVEGTKTDPETDKVEEDECKKEQTHHNDKDDVKKDNDKKEADDEVQDVSDSCEESSAESEDPVVKNQAFETWTWHQPMGDVEDMEWTAEDDDAWDADTDRDYYAALELTKSSNISSSRVRAAYHRLAHRWHPYHGSWRWEGDAASPDAPADAARRVALRRFWTIAEAYLVLADPERRRIYDECGFKGLKQSEACYAEPIFEKDAFQLYEDFFNGTDPEAREFLLMNCGAASSDESEDSGSGAEMEQLNLEAASAADGAEKKTLAMPVLPPDIAKAVGVEKVSAGLDDQFREILNSALSAAPSAAGEMDPEDAALKVNVETLDDKIQEAPPPEADNPEGLSSTTPCASQKKVFWKYWKGLRFGLRCPKPGT